MNPATCDEHLDVNASAEIWTMPERLGQASAIYPLGRLGEARDIAAAIAFFASPDASWVSGVTLPVDGGRSAVRAAGEARGE